MIIYVLASEGYKSMVNKFSSFYSPYFLTHHLSQNWKLCKGARTKELQCSTSFYPTRAGYRDGLCNMCYFYTIFLLIQNFCTLYFDNIHTSNNSTHLPIFVTHLILWHHFKLISQFCASCIFIDILSFSVHG